jgi:hypothetical protein
MDSCLTTITGALIVCTRTTPYALSTPSSHFKMGKPVESV